jgi:hypothetical protein
MNPASAICFCRFWFYIYYLVVISARICFLCYPIKSEFLTILLVDYFIDVFFFIDFFYLSKKYPLSLIQASGDHATGGSMFANSAVGTRNSFSSSFHKPTGSAIAVANRRRARTSSSGSVNIDSADEVASPNKTRSRSSRLSDDGDNFSEGSDRRSGIDSLVENAVDAHGGIDGLGARTQPHPISPGSVRSIDPHRPGHHSPHDHDGLVVGGSNTHKKTHPKTIADRLSEPETLFALFVFIPFELFFFAGDSPYYGYLRTTKLLHTWYFKRYWQGFVASIDHIFPSASGQRVIFFLLMHFLASHFASCGYFVIAYAEATTAPIERDNILTWMKLGVFNDGGDFELLHTCSFRYIRLFYFSVNVIVSIFLENFENFTNNFDFPQETTGFGDIVPRTVAEILFTIVVCFVGFFLCNLLISNFVILINGSDAAKINYLAQIEQLSKYTKLRSLPISIFNKISAFYEHQMVYLKGLNEKEVRTRTFCILCEVNIFIFRLLCFIKYFPINSLLNSLWTICPRVFVRRSWTR